MQPFDDVIYIRNISIKLPLICSNIFILNGWICSDRSNRDIYYIAAQSSGLCIEFHAIDSYGKSQSTIFRWPGNTEEESYIEIDMNLMRKTKAAYLVSERSQPMYVATVQLKFQLMVNIYTFQIVYHILSFCSSRAYTHTHTLKHTFCIRFTLSSWTTLANSLTKHSILFLL